MTQLRLAIELNESQDPSGYKGAQYEWMFKGEVSEEEFLQAKEKLYCSDKCYKAVRDELNGIEKIEQFERIKSADAEKVYSAVETVIIKSNYKITVEIR